MKNKICISRNRFAALALAAALPMSAQAVDGWSVEGGSGNGINVWRVGAQWNWDKRFFQGKEWHVRPYWDAQIGRWKGASSITDISLTPTFRLKQLNGRGIYLEGAIGFHYLSGKNAAANKQLGSNFQFGDHIQAGFRFGDKGNHDIGLRFQHHSNGGIKKPNPGVNFSLIRYQYHF
jgi:hypothetical protein